MKSTFVRPLAFGLMFACIATAASIASAQTSVGWGQHVSRYGSGYVGNAPNSAPMTSYYRSPTITGYAPAAYSLQGAAPVTAYYAPQPYAAQAYAPSYVAPAAYAPGVSYRVGTANAAAYTSGYAPLVTSSTPYAATWQYPPQTTMPVTANYLPAPPQYTTNYAQTPVTQYRPVTVLSPTGTPQTVLQPCTGYECQAQRKPTGVLHNLFHPFQQSAAPAAPCTSGYCGQPAATGVPYYTPAPAAGTPLPGPVSNVPANIAPTLSGPPVTSAPVTSGGTITSGPVTTTPLPSGTVISPNTGLSPSQFNSSGSSRADYPPSIDAYSPSSTSSFPPNVSPLPAAPLSPIAPETRPVPEIQSSEPADAAPSLTPPGNSYVPPSNAPIGSGLRYSPNQNVNAKPTSEATKPRESSITPIPDPEYRSGTRAHENKAPLLISPRDKTAQVIEPSVREPEARLASFESENKPKLAPAPPARKIHGDEIWRSAK